MATITQQQIDSLRTHIYRRTQARRLQTIEDAERFVNEVDFCFFWPIQGAELPNLFHAIAGRVRDVPSAHNDPDLSKCWGWKDQSLGQRRWYYAKLLRKKATLVSLKFLPVCYALSPNFGGEVDYLEDYEAGVLSWEAKNILEALIKTGPLDTIRLRRESRLSAESAKAAFERALVELQSTMRVLPVAVAEAGAWRYAFVYDLVPQHFPELPAQAQQLSRREARSRLIARLLENVVAASQTDIQRMLGVFKLTRNEVEKTLVELQEQGCVAEVAVAGMTTPTFVSVKALEMRLSRF